MRNGQKLPAVFSRAAANSAKRPAPFSLRLTLDERKKLEDQADGIPLGTFVKTQLFENAPVRKSVTDDKALAEALSLLGQSRIASNLNQLAKAAHIGTLPISSRVERDLDDACAHIAAIRACLVTALGLKSKRT